MLDLTTATAYTSGAYVLVNGLYPFQLGWKPNNGSYPIVRLGGHIEGRETGWQCAVREVREEANLSIRPVAAGKTYLVLADDPGLALHETTWAHTIHNDVSPLLAVAYDVDTSPRLSLMYLAESADFPTPCSEVKGLLLLEPHHIQQVCRETVTLGQYLQQGGKALFNAAFDPHRPLVPFLQLRILARLLAENKV